jgi:hypothetical protein
MKQGNSAMSAGIGGIRLVVAQLFVCLDIRFAYGWHHKSKVGLWTQGTYTALQHHQLLKETI